MADKTINDLTAATTLADGDLFEIENTGNNSRKITVANARTSLLTSVPRLLSRVTTAASQTSVAFSSIPGTFSHLRFIITGRSQSAGSADSMRMQFNSDTTNGNYGSQQVQGNNATASANANPSSINNYVGDLAAASATANQAASIELTIPLYANTAFVKQWHGVAGLPGFPIVKALSGRWNATTAITDIVFVLNSGGAFVNGSDFSLYGYP